MGYNYSGFMWPRDGDATDADAPCSGDPNPICMRFTECPTADLIDMEPYNGQYGPLRIDVKDGYSPPPTSSPTPSPVTLNTLSPTTAQPSASPATGSPLTGSPTTVSPATGAPSTAPTSTA